MMLFLYGCQSPTSNPETPRAGLFHTPVITGIWWTTEEYPDGFPDAARIGNPAYPVGEGKFARINAVPNPYLGFNPQETDFEETSIVFTHVPLRATVEIYRGVWVGQPVPPEETITGGAVTHRFIRPVRILHNDSTQFLRWDFRDEFDRPLPSGFYRAYFFTEDGEMVNFVDLYVISRLDCASWIDPTGALPPDWDVVVDEQGRRFSICDPDNPWWR
ncbi:MAG: hypothetical protein D6681_13495 [Calditrichaeota bacterium]|nr:MAG: hypothetical protein D6681_13495 [Calditrichota bacterium]